MSIELNNNKRMGLQQTERRSLAESENQTANSGLHDIVEESAFEKLKLSSSVNKVQ